MRKNFLTVIVLAAVFALIFAGCGNQKPAAETTAAAVTSVETTAPALGLEDFRLTATTWSSPNGATVTLTATPWGYAEGCSADFIVRLEGEEVANVPCEWDGSAYTASADLNAADGLYYYVFMTSSDGNTMEIQVNTPNMPTDEALINMASSLESYCHVMVEETAFSDGKLTLASGSVQIQAPKITNEGETITVSEAILTLNFNGQEVSTKKLDLTASQGAGTYELALTDVTFDVPEMENDQQLTLVLNVALSNGQSLTTTGGTFFYNDGELLTAVG